MKKETKLVLKTFIHFVIGFTVLVYTDFMFSYSHYGSFSIQWERWLNQYLFHDGPTPTFILSSVLMTLLIFVWFTYETFKLMQEGEKKNDKRKEKKILH